MVDFVSERHIIVHDIALNMQSTYLRGYLRGYEDAVIEVVDDIIRLSTRGYTGKELQLLLNTYKGGLKEKLERKIVELRGTLEVEVLKERPRTKELLEIGSYLVKEERPAKSLSILSSIPEKALNCLIISRVSPEKLEGFEDFKEKTPVWLSREGGEKDVDNLAGEVNKFLDRNSRGVIFFHGVDYLVQENGSDRALKFMAYLKEKVVKTNSYLIVSLNPETLNPTDCKRIESEIGETVE